MYPLHHAVYRYRIGILVALSPNDSQISPKMYEMLFLMTDSICHSSLPRTVLEKVTDYYSISYSSAHKSRPNVSMCVY